MAWIESHTVLIRHRKLIAMARALRLKPVYLLGHLHALWHAALEQQEDGDLSSWSDDLIAELSGYQGDALQYVSLLQQFGWLDGKLIHDWTDYVGRYLESKYRSSNPERLRTIWAKYSSEYTKAPARKVDSSWIKVREQVLTRDNHICHYCGKSEDKMEVDHLIPVSKGGTDELNNLVAACQKCNRAKGDRLKPYLSPTKASPPNQPNLTQPTKPKETSASPPISVWFKDIWDKYPNKDGKKLAERSFRASVRTEKDYQDIQTALGNYLKSEKVVKGFVKNGSTWFNNWRDWVDFVDPKAVVNEEDALRAKFGMGRK